MSSRRTLMRSLAAFCARIRPRHTAELASLVLYLGEEIDRRERMLDAALRAMVTVPGERAPGSPAASGRRAGPGSRTRSASLPPSDAPGQREGPATAGRRGKPRSRAMSPTPPAMRTTTALS